VVYGLELPLGQKNPEFLGHCMEYMCTGLHGSGSPTGRNKVPYQTPSFLMLAMYRV